jgi:hypothetical protein
MISLLKDLAASLKLYLELKNKLTLYEITNHHRKTKNEIISEIEKLRDSGDSNSSDRADILRRRLQAENENFKHISAIITKAEGGDSN